MSALFYKAWLETRVRFLAGLIAVAIVCIFQIEQHQTYYLPHLFGVRLGIPAYAWFLWQYLYVYFLQQVWVLFTVLLALDGLIREKASGTAAFSLGLPVSRRRWMFTRFVVVFMESAALSLFAVLVVIVGSAVVHQTFSLSQIFFHAVLLVAAGVIVIALGNLYYAVFPGNYRSLLVALAVLGIPYLWIQRHLPRTRVSDLPESLRAPLTLALTASHTVAEPQLPWWRYFDLAHVMAGPWQLSLSSTPWVALMVIWALTVLVLALTAAYGDRVDY
ncbi:MAG TPA: hypothetical protein VG672_00140 [Bryobacteraceae bacterium]|nr:hypothetical protein [Bryobacteraceae bacterium]HWB95067.1 hypothetical protein [Bryobacteraceae bacterium]